jgi:hypothetical protein
MRSILALLFLIGGASLLPDQQPDNARYGVMHRPKAGCPSGFFEVPDVFELRGRKSPGCVNIQKSFRPIDHLQNGEQWFPVFWGPWGWTKSIYSSACEGAVRQ